MSGTGMQIVAFGGVISSLFGGDAGKRPGSARPRIGGKHSIVNNIYWLNLVPALLLIIFGLLVVWSASLDNSDASLPRQAIGAALGICSGALMWRYDFRNLANMSTWLLIIVVVLMLSPRLPYLGYSAKGLTGWIKIGPLRFQPAELGKLCVIFLMASLGAQFNGRIKLFKDYAKLCGMLLIPFLAILLQPDLGTGLIILVTGAWIIVCSGARRDWVLITLGVVIIFATLLIIMSINFGFPLKEYQLNRLLVFIDPSRDTSGSGYNLMQAKIAVGSGGLFGKGLTGATQSSGGFLPENHTDFIFARLAEEFGFIGVLVLFALYGVLIFSTIRLAMRLDAPFSKLVLAGVASMWTYQLLQNVGMCIGIMPITGIPLPFISYGASSMVVQILAVGIVQSVYHHRPKSA